MISINSYCYHIIFGNIKKNNSHKERLYCTEISIHREILIAKLTLKEQACAFVELYNLGPLSKIFYFILTVGMQNSCLANTPYINFDHTVEALSARH